MLQAPKVVYIMRSMFWHVVHVIHGTYDKAYTASAVLQIQEGTYLTWQ